MLDDMSPSVELAAPPTPRRRRRQLVVVLSAAAVVVFLGALFTSLLVARSDASSASASVRDVATATQVPSASRLPYVDGQLVAVTPRALVLESADGTLRFTVAPDAFADVDLQHLRLHARDGLPTRVYFGPGRAFPTAEAVEDAPIAY